MRIRVLQRHIDKGRVASCVCCPIALAIREKVNSPVPVRVAGSVIRVGSYKCEPPKKVVDFINGFDTHGKAGVRPFTFTMEGL